MSIVEYEDSVAGASSFRFDSEWDMYEDIMERDAGVDRVLEMLQRVREGGEEGAERCAGRGG